jgi:hypothetical protein
MPAREVAAGHGNKKDGNVTFQMEGSQTWEKLKATAEKLVVKPWTEVQSFPLLIIMR